MATLEDTFLEDLEDSDHEVAMPVTTPNVPRLEGSDDEDAALNLSKRDADLDLSDNEDKPMNDVDSQWMEEQLLFADMEPLIDIDIIEKQDKPLVSGPWVETVSDLLNSIRLTRHLEQIDATLRNCVGNRSGHQLKSGIESNSEHYALIVESNRLALEIDNHLIRVHKFMRDIYATKFPELEEMVVHPIEYAKCVKMIANKTPEEMSDLPLDKILSNPSAGMMVNVTASTTTGKQLQTADLERVMHAADVMLELEMKKAIILDFVTTRMNVIAPNLAELVGCEITAKLIGLVGSIERLSRMPSCNVQVIGAQKKSQTAFSMVAIDPNVGIISQCDLIRNCPPNLQLKALRLVAGKIVLCARCDANQNTPSAAIGIRLRTECENKIEKWQEPPPPKPPRPLSVPDNKPKKKRGGKRYRNMRERYKVTETQRMQNRMAFGKAEEEVIDGNGEIIGLGMIGSAADVGGRLRAIAPKANTTTLHKLHKRQILKQKRLRMKAEKAGTVSGIHTSVLFTPVQGIELSNPDAAPDGTKKDSQKYFTQDDIFANKKFGL